MGTLISNKDGECFHGDVGYPSDSSEHYPVPMYIDYISSSSNIVHSHLLFTFCPNRGWYDIALELYYSNSQVISIITLINRRLYYSIELPYNVGDEKEVGFE